MTQFDDFVRDVVDTITNLSKRIKKLENTPYMIGGTGTPTNLDSLTDVVITTPAAGEVLGYNGANWVNGSAGAGDMTKAEYDADNDGSVDSAEAAPWAGITGKPATFPPDAHNTSHQSGGGDAIKLDDLSAPDDNTDLDASTLKHGLLLKLDGSTTKYLRADGTWQSLPAATPPTLEALFTVEGDLVTSTGVLRIYNATGVTKTISKVFLSVSTAPTGAAIIVDIHKGGTTIFTTQANRPQIAASANTGYSTTIDVTSWADGEYLTMDVDQVGSTIAGSNLTVHIVYS